ncbi:hypothetical protein [Dyadobacter sp. BHUBP1]|uniref:hypothetical protein n=1 Tax=Dyadobacter sp. BHUBP1 TaxID=3424178 RepID=UPI003D357498
MARYLFFALLMLHGLIHLAGFFAPATSDRMEIYNAPGAFWVGCAILFCMTSILFLFSEKLWIAVALVSVIASQAVIVSEWSQARFGTVINGLVLLVVFFLLFSKNAPVIFRD